MRCPLGLDRLPTPALAGTAAAMEEAARRVRCCIMFFLLALAGAHAAAKGQFPEWRFQGRDVVVKIPRDSVRPSTQLKQTHSV